jgi:hypothetical protein
MADYVFHVLHNAKPDFELDALTLLEHGQESSYEAILNEGKQLGYTIGHQVKTERQLKDVLQLLRDLYFMERRRVQLTNTGQVLAQIAFKNPNLPPEIIHFFYYTTWQKLKKSENCFSWSYRRLCDHLWQQGSAVLDKTELSSFVSSEASESFQIQSVSFSTNSVNGIMMWLEALDPPVLHQDEMSSEYRFSRRSFCTPELFTLAIDYVYRQDALDYGSNLLVNEARRHSVCQLCLLEVGSFDRVLEYAIAQFDFLESGIGGGWGQYITLNRQPTLEDFV